jgi:Beta-lactamase class C and other penicillin binding proteins
MKVKGTAKPGYEKVWDAFEEAQEKDEGGAQLAVYRYGEKVVDIWTGQDVVKGRPFPENGIGILTSATKGLTATAAHLLIQRGQLELEAPVARYWPEFAENGKENVTVAQLMSHQAGIPGFLPEDGIVVSDLWNWTRMTGALAHKAPYWEPGTAYMYHSVFYGYLVGELVRRASGKTVGTFFHDEIAKPLGLDLWIGLPAEQEPRFVPQLPQNGITYEQYMAFAASSGLDTNHPLVRSQGALMDLLGKAFPIMNEERMAREAEVPAGNGIGDARSLARFYASLIGEVDGIRILSDKTIADATIDMTSGKPVAGPFANVPDKHPLRFALGYELSRSGNPMLGEGSFGHTGSGGRLAFAHPASGISIGYICNNMLWDYRNGPDARWVGWLAALGEIAGI